MEADHATEPGRAAGRWNGVAGDMLPDCRTMRPSELLKLKRNEILALAAKAGAMNVRVFGSALTKLPKHVIRMGAHAAHVAFL